MKIIVGIPIFNQNLSYFRECLESIKNQTYDPQMFEVIVLDDGSKNKEAVEKITKEFGFKYVYQENQGIGSARSAIVDNASKESDYITFLSSDDIWEPNYLETMIKEAEKHPQKIIYSNYYLVDGEGNIIRKFNPPSYDNHEDFCIACLEFAKRNTMFCNFSCVLIPHKTFEKVKFRKEYKFCEDLMFLLESALVHKIKYYLVPQYLLKYRAVDNTTSRIMDKIPEQNIKIRKKCMEYWKNG